jgi:hypothetical protein
VPESKATAVCKEDKSKISRSFNKNGERMTSIRHFPSKLPLQNKQKRNNGHPYHHTPHSPSNRKQRKSNKNKEILDKVTYSVKNVQDNEREGEWIGEELWLFDTGATIHVCQESNGMFNLRKSHQIVKVAEGSKAMATFKGSLLLKGTKGGLL